MALAAGYRRAFTQVALIADRGLASRDAHMLMVSERHWGKTMIILHCMVIIIGGKALKLGVLVHHGLGLGLLH
mgnify:FL=1